VEFKRLAPFLKEAIMPWNPSKRFSMPSAAKLENLQKKTCKIQYTSIKSINTTHIFYFKKITKGSFKMLVTSYSIG
jgi:hypothetical protein